MSPLGAPYDCVHRNFSWTCLLFKCIPLQLFNPWTHLAFSDQSSTVTQKLYRYNDFPITALFILLEYFSRRIIVWLTQSLSCICSRFIVSLLASLLSTTLKSAEDKITVTGRNVVSLQRRWKNLLGAKKKLIYSIIINHVLVLAIQAFTLYVQLVLWCILG